MAAKATGRPTMFIPEIRAILIQNMTAGATVKDSCAMAGISEAVFYKWMVIGAACRDDEPAEGKPEGEAEQASFVEFVEAVEKARAAQRLRAVTSIIRAGVERWVHSKTGIVRFSPPPPITWLNEATGEMVFADPTALDPDGTWTKEFSGESWKYDGGSWQAHGWFLERRYPEEYGRQIQDVRVNLDGMTDEELEKLAKGGR